MITGTNYFQSRVAAEEYYKLQGFNRSDVSYKIASGEIKIGFPVEIVRQFGSNVGFKLGKDADGRYNYTFNCVVKGV
jgi:hypothetical protein